MLPAFQKMTFRRANSSLKQSEIPGSIISSAEGIEDGLAWFTSLVRARD